MRIFDQLINSIRISWAKKTKNLLIGSGLILRGRPIIDIRDGASIEIGQDVTLNSQNFGYHINIFAPVKLFANINRHATIKIGDRTRIHGSCIHARERIEIGKNCLIAGNCQIFDCNAHHLSMENPANRINTTDVTKPVIIEDNVWICVHSIILPGVRIGRGSIVAAGSVVTKDVPPDTLVGGNPAKPIVKNEIEIWKEKDNE